MASGSKEYQLAIKIAGRVDSSFAAAMSQVSTSLKSLGAMGAVIGSSVKIASGAFTATAAAVAGVGIASAKAGAEFDNAMSQVAATMGTTMEGLQESVGTVDLAWGSFTGNLREYALEMGAHTAFSAKQSAEALNYMALAGYDAQTSMQMLPNVLSLAAAGSMELATASDMITDTQTAFGLSLERTTQMVDEMAKAASTGNTSVEQMGEAFLTVGGLAKELNGGIVTLSDGTAASVDGVQELEIALTAMANAGIKGSEAGTHMRNMLLKLSSPTAAGVKALDSLGVSVYDDAGAMRSLSDIFGDLSGSMANLTQEEKLAAISDLFNTRDTATAEALLNAVGQDWDNIGEAILNAEGAAQQMADVQLDNLAGDVTLFKSALEGVEIAISDTVNPALRNMVQFATEQLGVLSEAIKTGGLSGLTEAMGGILTEALVEVSSYASDFLNVVFSVSDGIFDALRSNAPRLAEGAATLATQFLSGFIRYYGEFWSTGAELLSEFLFGMIRNMPEIVQSGITMMQGLSEGLTSRFPGIVESARRIAVMLIDGLSVMLPQFIETGAKLISQLATGVAQGAPSLIVSLLNVVFLSAQSIAEQLPMLASAGITLIGGLLEGVLAGLDYIYTSGVDIALNLVDGLLSALPELIVQAGTVALEFLSGLTDTLPTIVEGGMRMMVGLLQGITQNLPAILQTGIQVIGALESGILRAIPTLISYLPTLFFGFVDAIFSINWLQVGIDLVKAIWQGLVSAFSELLDLGKDLFGGLAGLFTGGGTDAVSAAAAGLESGAPALGEAASHLTGTTMSGFQFNTAQIAQYGTDAGLSLASGVDAGTYAVSSSAMNAGMTLSASMEGGILAGSTDLSGTASNLGAAAATALNSSVLDNLPAVDAAALASGSAITDGITSGIDSGMSGAAASAASASVETINAMADGIAQGASTITSTIETLTATVTSSLEQCWANVSASAQGAWDGIGAGTEAGLSGATASVHTQMSAIQSVVHASMSAVVVAVHTSMTAASSAVTVGMASVRSSFASVLPSVLSTTRTTFSSIASSISTEMNRAKQAVTSAVSAMKSAMHFSWSLPRLKLPHISVSGKFSVNPPSVPKFGISWYKQGGILDGAQIFGMAGNNLLGGGEAGKEAVLPLSELWTQMRSIMAEVLNAVGETGPSVPGGALDVLTQALDSISNRTQSPIASVLDALTSGGGEQPKPATANGAPNPPLQITYAPTYRFEGEAPSKKDMVEAAKISQEEFEERMRKWLRDNDRKSF